LARAAAKGNKRTGKAARPAGKSGHVAGSTGPRRRPDYENQLFFGRLRSQTKWVFAVLAFVFAASFIFLGVGSGSSALTDILNGNIHLFGGSSGPSVNSLESKVAKDPTNAKLRLQLAELLVAKNKTDEAITAYTKYLKLKPGDNTGLLGLANVYSTKITGLQNEIQAPPTPPLASANAFLPVSQATTLGAALASLQPISFSITSLKQGETDLLQKQLANAILKHIGVYRTVAAKSPTDSDALLEVANIANQDGAITIALATYQQFLKKYPSDPLVPDVKKQIKALEKRLAGTAGQTG
jgi:tetratricopeptide (TPR) repeat protein